MNQTEYMLELIRNSIYATGADFSHHKGEWDLTDVDMELFSEVMDFAILRAGYGAEDGKIYTDSKFFQNYEVLEDYPVMRRGVYWYLSSHSPPQAQLAYFLDLIKDMEFEMIIMDVEALFNEPSKTFADGSVWTLNELERLFADKQVMLYNNRYEYVDYIWKYNKEIDKFNYWIAQYPWRNWVNWFTDYFKAWWSNLFDMQKTPHLPASRPPNGWELWQVIASSGIGHELGFESDELDYNVSRRTKDEFFEWLGQPDRLEVEPPPVEPTDKDAEQDQRLESLEQAMNIITKKVLDLEEGVASCNDQIAILSGMVGALEDHTHGEPPPPPIEPPPIVPPNDYHNTYNYAYKGTNKANFYRGKLNEDSGRTKLLLTNKRVAWNNTIKLLGFPVKIGGDWFIRLNQAGIDEGARANIELALHLEDVKSFEQYEDVRYVEFEGARGFIFANVAQLYKNGNGDNL